MATQISHRFTKAGYPIYLSGSNSTQHSHFLEAVVEDPRMTDTQVGVTLDFGGSNPRAENFQKTLSAPITCTLKSLNNDTLPISLKELKSIGYDEVLALEDDKFEENVLDVTNGVGFDLSYDCVGGSHFVKLVNTVKARGLIVNYGNLNLDYSKIYTLPLLGKRIHLRFHSIFDTMRFADQRKEGVDWINDQMNKGKLKPIISDIDIIYHPQNKILTHLNILTPQKLNFLIYQEIFQLIT